MFSAATPLIVLCNQFKCSTEKSVGLSVLTEHLKQSVVGRSLTSDVIVVTSAKRTPLVYRHCSVPSVSVLERFADCTCTTKFCVIHDLYFETLVDIAFSFLIKTFPFNIK